MTNALREQLFKLSAAERLELVEELRDSIADENAALALTDEQREDLERRLAEADSDPTDGSPWEEVRERIGHRSRKKRGPRPDFGAPLRELRITARYTQQEIAHEVGVSRRMIAYHEGETERPPAALLPAFAAALGVSTDELLGVATPRKRVAKPDRRLQRRMQQIERMNPKEKRQALQILDALIERDQLRASKG